MKPGILLFSIILLLSPFCGLSQVISNVSPDNGEQGASNILINITGSGTAFIPGTTNCAQLSGGLTATINGMASSPTEFTGFLTIPIFAPAGSYDIIVYEGPGCTGASWSCSDCFTVCSPLNIFGVPTNATCYQCTDGAINLSVFGGTLPYTFDWSNGATTEDVSGLGAGSYSVTITDGTGCNTVRNYTITEPEAISVTPPNASPGDAFTLSVTGNISLFSMASTTCVEISNGTDTYPATGSATSGTDFSADFVLPQDAAPGLFDVTVFEGPGCTGAEWSCSGCFAICNPMTITGIVTDASCAVCADGSIDITVSGGQPPLTYIWSNGSMNQDPNLLAADTYTVTVTDAHGCQATSSFTVTEPDPITLNPNNGNQNQTVSLIVTGVGTNFLPGTTTCLELQNDIGETFLITGSASNSILFNASFTIPLGATPGSYNATIYEDGCTGTNWSCNDCFTINDILNCGATIYDNGGQFGNYLNNTIDTWTICPDNPGEVVSVLFSLFDLENDGDNCLDELTIYDGDDTGDPVIASPNGTTNGWCWDQSDASSNGSGNLEGMTISSTDPSGCLTFNFTSDDVGTRPGWAFEVQCNQDIVFSPSSASRGSSLTLTITGFGTNFSTSLTTCAEIAMGTEIYQITGTATSPTSFSGTIDIPLGASQGLYNGTVYEGPNCTGGSFQQAIWTCVNCFQVLPPNLSVEWLSFDATARATDILLKWSTATESNSDFFGVEKSRNGQSWEEIGRVTATGTSTSVSFYQFSDNDPLTANNYYRIRQVDLDGSYSYSNVEVVKFGQEASVIEIFPNPVRNQASVVVSSLWSEKITLKLTDISGKTLQTWNRSVNIGTQVFDLDLGGWPNGVYFLSAEGGQNWQPVRFTKIK